jgi:hypothetical protein
MFKKSNAEIVTALCTAGGIVVFALYERHGASAPMSATTLFYAAAAICVLPAAVRFVACRMKG